MMKLNSHESVESTTLSVSSSQVSYDVYFAYPLSSPTNDTRNAEDEQHYYKQLVSQLIHNITNSHFTILLHEYSHLLNGNLTDAVVMDRPQTTLHARSPSKSPTVSLTVSPSTNSPTLLILNTSYKNATSSSNFILPLIISVSI